MRHFLFFSTRPSPSAPTSTRAQLETTSSSPQAKSPAGSSGAAASSAPGERTPTAHKQLQNVKQEPAHPSYVLIGLARTYVCMRNKRDKNADTLKKSPVWSTIHSIYTVYTRIDCPRGRLPGRLGDSMVVALKFSLRRAGGRAHVSEARPVENQYIYT
ncbi:hypothetical protein EVAR_57609_1 [Eumeta japonica]|uniref:Uncharacterized protein n=1 Tax=Eumeta variegata TaxID=151549 RepID=A0A4C1XYN9_EUMVA|nr:hypothetical protein EVAR_57609_1 [Eumeta japonica]